jgi:hypothetical protein
MVFGVSLLLNMRCLIKNLLISLQEIVIIVNIKKKYYYVVTKKAGAWKCRGDDTILCNSTVIELCKDIF